MNHTSFPKEDHLQD